MIDACSRATILDYLMQLRNEIGMTVIFITHDIGLAYYVSDTVCRVIDVGPKILRRSFLIFGVGGQFFRRGQKRIQGWISDQN